MKALTLWQPWASLMAYGYKTIETRSWGTSYRGPLAIHAAKTPQRSELAELALPRFLEPLSRELAGVERSSMVEIARLLPRGVVVAVVELVACVPMIDSFGMELAFESGGPDALLIDDGRLTLRLNDRDLDVTDQAPYGDFRPGRWAWVTGELAVLERPVPARGRQQLWEWEPAA